MRRFLEAVALHTWSLRPQVVRDVIDDLRAFAPFVVDDYVDNLVHPQRGSATYGFRGFKNDAERAVLREIFAERERILTSSVLRIAGERYVRHHFANYSTRFESVTPEAKLGYVTASAGEGQLDLTVVADGKRYGVSVKNTRDHLEPRTMGWVDEVEKMTEGRGMAPWIIPSFATPEAIEACRARGVLCTPIGYRIAPAKHGTKFTPVTLRRLYPTLGPEPFRFIGAQRVHDHDLDFIDRLEQTIAYHSTNGHRRFA